MKKIHIIGNIGNDATVRTTNGSTAINFNVAVNESYKDAEGVKQERTDWFSCTMWRTNTQSTEIAKYLKKGTQVYVEGNPNNQIYKNRDNQPAIDQQVRVLEVKLLTGPSNNTSPAATATNGATAAASTAPTTAGPEPDDLPF